MPKNKYFKILESSEFPCGIVSTTSYFLNQAIPAAIYIKCTKITFHISIFYPRGKFYWIPADNYQLSGNVKLLNDHERALNKFFLNKNLFELITRLFFKIQNKNYSIRKA